MREPLLQPRTDIALAEGLRERAFRRRVLWLCGLTPILQVVSVICVLSISELVPVNVRTFGFSVVVLTIVSFLVLETAWFVFRKRGTGHHHLYMLLLIIPVSLLNILANGWYLVLLITFMNRIGDICYASKSTSLPCVGQWLVAFISLAVLWTLTAALTLAIVVLGTRLVSHGHKRKIAAIAEGLRDEREQYRLW